MQQRILLGINIDHIATVRQARGTRYPDPVTSAQEAILGGADGITVHLREDQRHIQARDVELLKQTLTVPMNLEMAVTPAMIDFACRIKPEKCCLVPEKREELTTEGGLNVIAQQQQIQQAVAKLKAQNIEVSLFIEADPRQIQAARDVGAPVIELHTGTYADAEDSATQFKHLQKLNAAAILAHELGLIVNAGHGLNYQNTALIAGLPYLVELNIGHAIIARALQTGLQQAVRDMQTLLWRCRA